MRLTHVERQVLGQDGEHARGMFRPDLRQHHGDGLRVFVLEVIGEHLLLHVGELLPHVAAGGAADFLHDVADPLRRQVLLQQPLGRVVIAHDRAGRRHARDEFEQQIFDQLGFDRADGRHHDGNLAQLVVVEHAPDLGAVLLAEREHQHGRALGPVQLTLGRRRAPTAAGEARQRAGDFALGGVASGFYRRVAAMVLSIRLRRFHAAIGG